MVAKLDVSRILNVLLLLVKYKIIYSRSDVIKLNLETSLKAGTFNLLLNLHNFDDGIAAF